MKIRHAFQIDFCDTRSQLRRRFKKTKYLQRKYRGIAKGRQCVQVYSNICFDMDRFDRKVLRSLRKTGFRGSIQWYY